MKVARTVQISVLFRLGLRGPPDKLIHGSDFNNSQLRQSFSSTNPDVDHPLSTSALHHFQKPPRLKGIIPTVHEHYFGRRLDQSPSNHQMGVKSTGASTRSTVQIYQMPSHVARKIEGSKDGRRRWRHLAAVQWEMRELAGGGGGRRRGVGNGSKVQAANTQVASRQSNCLQQL